jgi:hypothetical protein
VTLTEFLLARIAEDEAAANAAHRESMRGHAGPGFARSRVAWAAQAEGVRGSALIERFTPARVLAECEAKRRVVEHCDFDHLALSVGDPYVLQLLALPYADHPDYRDDWKP